MTCDSVLILTTFIVNREPKNSYVISYGSVLVRCFCALELVFSAHMNRPTMQACTIDVQLCVLLVYSNIPPLVILTLGIGLRAAEASEIVGTSLVPLLCRR